MGQIFVTDKKKNTMKISFMDKWYIFVIDTYKNTMGVVFAIGKSRKKKQTNKEHVFVIDTYKKGNFFLDKYKK